MEWFCLAVVHSAETLYLSFPCFNMIRTVVCECENRSDREGVRRRQREMTVLIRFLGFDDVPRLWPSEGLATDSVCVFYVCVCLSGL